LKICPSAAGPAMIPFQKENPEYLTEILRKVPLGRFGEPEKDIGRVAVFLAGEDSDFMTGGTLMVDGGHCMCA
jgi:NAD(P)-dependent dehydrogenase (short-subunit alcohol dehydrogenase family)